jgi:methyl-accepting chemotaxis protein
MATASLVKQLSSIGVQISDVATAPYYQSLSEYNQAVRDLKRMIEKGSDTSEQMTSIAKLQAKVREKAENFVKQERMLIDGLFKNKTAAPSDPCQRSL